MLRLFLDKIYICYLDNIFVYSEDKKQYSIYMEQVLEVFSRKGFRLKLSKYKFYIRRIIFLGYVIILGKISLDPEKVKTIITWEILIIVKQIQSFLGFVNFYKKFIKLYSKVVLFLIDLTRKNQVFKWTENIKKMFQELKQTFAKELIC
jgi:hypothetical protein